MFERDAGGRPSVAEPGTDPWGGGAAVSRQDAGDRPRV